MECFRARTAQEQNAALDADLHWNHAISLSLSDPYKLRFVANFAEQSRAPAVALKAYDQLVKFPEHASYAYRGIQRLSGTSGDPAIQRAAAEKNEECCPGDDPNAAAQLTYLNLLAGMDVESNTSAARALAKKYPDRLAFRVTAALGLLRQHDPGLALKQFKGPPVRHRSSGATTQAAWRAVYAATLMANEQTAEAQDFIKTIPLNQLSPEERALIEAK